MVRIAVHCPDCGARYSIKSTYAGKRLKCKCGTILSTTGNSTPVKDLTQVASTEMQTSNPNMKDDNFLQSSSDARASAKSVGAASMVTKPSCEVRRFCVTTAMGPYAGRLTFIALTIIVLILVNGLLLAFSISPITAVLIWSPLAIFAFFYRAIAVDANKMVVEVDDKHLAIRFLKRLPWPVRDKTYPLAMILRTYVDHRLVTKPFFSNTHRDDTEVWYNGSRYYENVYAYFLMLKMSGNRWPICIAIFEDQSLANSISDFVNS